MIEQRSDTKRRNQSSILSHLHTLRRVRQLQVCSNLVLASLLRLQAFQVSQDIRISGMWLIASPGMPPPPFGMQQPGQTPSIIPPPGGKGMPFPPFPPGPNGQAPPNLPNGMPFPPPPGGFPPNFQFPPPGGFPPPGQFGGPGAPNPGQGQGGPGQQGPPPPFNMGAPPGMNDRH
jgi:hypothetical protein